MARIPLSPPRFAHLPLPNPQVLRRKAVEVASFIDECYDRADRDKEEARDLVIAWCDELMPHLRKADPSVDDSAEARGAHAAALMLGTAMAVVEAEKGWQKPSQVDDRVDCAIAMQATSQDTYTTVYALAAGYWLARTHGEGVEDLVADLQQTGRSGDTRSRSHLPRRRPRDDK